MIISPMIAMMKLVSMIDMGMKGSKKALLANPLRIPPELISNIIRATIYLNAVPLEEWKRFKFCRDTLSQ